VLICQINNMTAVSPVLHSNRCDRKPLETLSETELHFKRNFSDVKI